MIQRIFILCLCLGYSSTLLANSDSLSLDEEPELVVQEVPVESIQNFVQIYAIVKDNYVTEKPDEVLFDQATRGLVSGLDRYSRYLNPEEYQQLLQYTEGDLASVDFDLAYQSNTQQWLIHGLNPKDDSAKLGLRNGASVSKIDKQELKNLNQEQVKALLTGEIGTQVEVQLAQSATPITLVRTKKIDTDIQYKLLKDHVLVLKINVFQQDTANQIKNIIERYQRNELKAVLLDLRNNPGGLLSAAVESADLFLEDGVIVSTQSRSEGNHQFQALPGFEFKNLKLGILINQRSASAAEVFTAALKDHQRAWVVGEKSYGKGVVQKLFPLSNQTALQMTVAHYFTPKGKMIEGIGIEPNLTYPMSPDMKDDVYLLNIADMLLTH